MKVFVAPEGDQVMPFDSVTTGQTQLMKIM